ncbi:MAG: S1 RNA-binding domain-containing protein [Anaerolineales bacterium]
MTTNKTSSQEIERKMKFTGKVIKTTLAGIIVDVGLEKPGVVHISNMSTEQIKKVEDIVEVGQEVDVWVRRIKKDANHIEMTMIEPLALEWREIKKGMVVTGEVVRLEKFGAFIEVGAERPGLAHISELTHDFVRRPEDAVKVGDEVQAKVIDFSRRKTQIKLSLKALQEAPEDEMVEEEQEDNTPALTAMEIAYRKALGGQEEMADQGSEEGDTPKSKSKQDDIISRTLEQKSKS